MGAVQLVTPGKSISRALSPEMPQCDEPAGSTPEFPRPSCPQHLLLSSYHQARCSCLASPRVARPMFHVPWYTLGKTPFLFSCSFRPGTALCSCRRIASPILRHGSTVIRQVRYSRPPCVSCDAPPRLQGTAFARESACSPPPALDTLSGGSSSANRGKLSQCPSSALRRCRSPTWDSLPL